MKLELTWICANIVTSLYIESNRLEIENLFYDDAGDLTKRKLAATVNLLVSLLRLDS